MMYVGVAPLVRLVRYSPDHFYCIIYKYNHSKDFVQNATYGTAQFKLDTRVQQTRVHLTDFVEVHASCSHAGYMAREHICTIEYTARVRAYTRHDMHELRHEARQKPIARKQMHSRG